MLDDDDDDDDDDDNDDDNLGGSRRRAGSEKKFYLLFQLVLYFICVMYDGVPLINHKCSLQPHDINVSRT